MRKGETKHLSSREAQCLPLGAKYPFIDVRPLCRGCACKATTPVDAVPQPWLLLSSEHQVRDPALPFPYAHSPSSDPCTPTCTRHSRRAFLQHSTAHRTRHFPRHSRLKPTQPRNTQQQGRYVYILPISSPFSHLCSPQNMSSQPSINSSTGLARAQCGP